MKYERKNADDVGDKRLVIADIDPSHYHMELMALHEEKVSGECGHYRHRQIVVDYNAEDQSCVTINETVS